MIPVHLGSVVLGPLKHSNWCFLKVRWYQRVNSVTSYTQKCDVITKFSLIRNIELNFSVYHLGKSLLFKFVFHKGSCRNLLFFGCQFWFRVHVSGHEWYEYLKFGWSMLRIIGSDVCNLRFEVWDKRLLRIGGLPLGNRVNTKALL